MTEMKRSEIEVITCLCSNPLFLFIGTQGMTEINYLWTDIPFFVFLSYCEINGRIEKGK